MNAKTLLTLTVVSVSLVLISGCADKNGQTPKKETDNTKVTTVKVTDETPKKEKVTLPAEVAEDMKSAMKKVEKTPETIAETVETAAKDVEEAVETKKETSAPATEKPEEIVEEVTEVTETPEETVEETTDDTETAAQVPTIPCTIPASDITDHTLTLNESGHGAPCLKWGDSGYLQISVDAPEAGEYTLSATYTCDSSMPVDVYVNGEKVLEQVAAEKTDGWKIENAQKVKLGTITLTQGANEIKLKQEKKHFFPLFSVSVE